MVKILLYGGCHALVLRDYLEAAFSDLFDCELLINFALVGSGRPFPYETLERFDFLVYSPIENRGEYNTSHLHDFCRSLRTQTICYPWLEWHGYCPGASKGLFKGRHQWYFPRLIERAASFEGDFDAFCQHALGTFPDDDEIDGVLKSSTARVSEAEARHDMPVTVSDFICREYAESRLFLISDHPSRAVYLHLLVQILRLIGIDRREIARRLATLPPEEPQWRWRTPIFPKVAQRIGLRFEDRVWLDDELVPGNEFSLRTYLGLYFHSGGLILGPTCSAPIVIPSIQTDESVQTIVDETTRLFALQSARGAPDVDREGVRREGSRPEGVRREGMRDEYVLLQALSGGDVPLSPSQRFVIDSSQWRSTWSF